MSFIRLVTNTHIQFGRGKNYFLNNNNYNLKLNVTANGKYIHIRVPCVLGTADYAVMQSFRSLYNSGIAMRVHVQGSRAWSLTDVLTEV